MGCTETPVGVDLATLLAGHIVEPTVIFATDADSPESDVPSGMRQISDTPEHSPCDSKVACGAEIAERETHLSDRPLAPNDPTAAQVGVYFATEIADNAAEALGVSARLGPKRVLALLV